MPAVQFVGITTKRDLSGSQTISLPAGTVAGDFAIFALVVTGTSSAPTASGFDSFTANAATDDGLHLAYGTRRVGVESSYTYQSVNTNQSTAMLAVYRNVSSVQATQLVEYHGQGTNASSTIDYPDPPAIALTGGAVVLVAGVNAAGGIAPSGSGFTGPSGYTQRFAGAHQSNFTSNHAGAWYDQIASGAADFGNNDGTYTLVSAGSIFAESLAFTLAAQNSVPNPPGAFTAPASGASVNTTATVTFGAGSDPDGGPLLYDTDLSTDNGGVWTRIRSDHADTSFVYDFTNVQATTAAILRARTRDNTGLNSGYTQGPVFTVAHNVAPTPPTLTSPVGNVSIDRTAAQRFTWQVNDADVGDSQSKYDIRYRLTGAPSWTTITVTTTAPMHDFAAGTFAAGAHEWQVQTYDSQGLPSAFTGSGFFTAATPPTGPTLLQPLNNSTIATATGVVEWSYPTEQAYQVRKVADLAGAPDTATVLFDTGIVENATARTVALTYPVNGRVEHIQVRIRENGLWSPWSSVKITVSYTPPAVPTVTVAGSNPTATINLTIGQPAPSGSQPIVTSVDVLRREGGVGDEVRIATGVAPTVVHADRTPASGVSYQYRVRAVAANGTTADTAWTG